MQTSPQAATIPSDLLAGKVAIITGASRGIGAVSAHVFAAAGATVVLAARDEQALETVAAQIRSSGARALVAPTDAGDAAAVERLIQRTLDTYGRLDAAFNNAADTHRPTPLADLSVEDFDRVMHSGLRGVFLSMKYEIPAMLASGGGAIVNMSSTAGAQGVRGMSIYSSVKHGVVGLTKSAALDYAARGIRVNAIAPGPIMNDRLRALDEQQLGRVASAVPMARLGQPEEVAAMAAWLCSDLASFITGATLSIDGGRLAGA
ncbi:MAG TPA: SDR family NAD(P)-dependent oxidoreductase [Ktedonobacterales bacterium]|jgi:NAD(P)-dependent dehydrogenase (short-subunit alcohol dehydrogenase family)|nr:SDR family NAD(P)-dependent oxidoreductase [Ktedonobacterales bacterium]